MRDLLVSTVRVRPPPSPRRRRSSRYDSGLLCGVAGTKLRRHGGAASWAVPRASLITAFKHFLSKQWEKAKAQKRGSGRVPLSLDFDSADSTFRIEADSGRTAEQLYDQQWAIALLGRILERLEVESQQAGKGNRFAELKGFIIGDHSGATYAAVAKNLGMSEAAAKKSASRMRRRFGQLLREEIAHTVGRPDEVEDEIRNLFAILEA